MLHAIIGVLSVIVGFALLRTPFQSVEVFIFVLGIFWLVQGVMTFVAAFSQKQGRNWRIFMGLLGILAGIVILTYPISSAVTLAFIGGIWLVVLGFMQVFAGFQLRAVRGGPDPGPRPVAPGLRAILSRGASPAPMTLAASAFARDPASSLRRSSVVERAAVNRLVVGSSPTAGANFLHEWPHFGLLRATLRRPLAGP